MKIETMFAPNTFCDLHEFDMRKSKHIKYSSFTHYIRPLIPLE